MRHKDELTALRDTQRLASAFHVPNAAAPIEVTADLTRRSVDVGMTLRAPDDKKTSKARVNWLLRQIRTENPDDIYIRLLWPGRSEATQFILAELRADAGIVEKDKEHLNVIAFHVFMSKRLGVRITQQANFIADLEELVPDFYAKVGAHLVAWKKRAPQIKSGATAEDVDTGAISDESDTLASGGGSSPEPLA